MNSQQNLGIYVHIPYCKQKCNYCDFYSLADPKTALDYAQQASKTIVQAAKELPYKVDTVYFGGGTPNMMPKEGLAFIMRSIRESFAVSSCAEITCEINPGEGYPTSVEDLADLGVNRLSVGLQSAVEGELAVLGRRHTPDDVKALIHRAQAAGIHNYSVDLMWGIPHQTVTSALQSLERALSLNPTHISAYMLKIEEGTPFGKTLPPLPDEDAVCDIYETCCYALERAGYPRYEISNFAKAGYESRHNLKYWNCENTLGIGPAAHSLVDGKRFYYPRDLHGFMNGDPPIYDGTGGDFTEYAMLQLRLASGLQQQDCMQRFGHPIPRDLLVKAKPMIDHGLMTYDGNALCLTIKGNLVSNEVLAMIL